MISAAFILYCLACCFVAEVLDYKLHLEKLSKREHNKRVDGPKI